METIIKAYQRIQDTLNDLPIIQIDEVDSKRAILIITDMVNGFAHEGVLSSPRVKGIIEPIVKLAKRFQDLGVPIVAFADTHPESAAEFDSYSPHCIAGSKESEIVPELESAIIFKRIDKNSTNGYLEPEFQRLLEEQAQLDQFVIVGNCTDICIQQLAVSLKAHYNRINQRVDIIVPVNGVQTYDYDLHHGDLLHTMGLYMMLQNGVRVVKGITLDREGHE